MKNLHFSYNPKPGNDNFHKFLLLLSACTTHFCNQVGVNNTDAFNSLFSYSTTFQNVLLITTGAKNLFLLKNISYNNWYKDNLLKVGLFKGQRYKRGYFEIFKSNKYLPSCQVQIVDIKTPQGQLFSYLYNLLLNPSRQAIVRPNYLVLSFRNAAGVNRTIRISKVGPQKIITDAKSYRKVLRIYSPLPIFCICGNIVYISPFVWKIIFQPKTGVTPTFLYFEYSLPLRGLNHTHLLFKNGVLTEFRKQHLKLHLQPINRHGFLIKDPQFISPSLSMKAKVDLNIQIMGLLQVEFLKLNISIVLYSHQ